jgi:D-tyrosyl-tRNA(Tyr) deacylase
MKAVVQRVNSATLKVDGKIISEIDKGLVCYLGVGKGDTEKELEWLAKKTAKLRIFPDEAGKMNLSAFDCKLGILVVSQFTLYGDIRNGYRPSFTGAEAPELAQNLYEKFKLELEKIGIKKVVGGVFGADMKIAQENDGPVTIILDTAVKKGN